VIHVVALHTHMMGEHPTLYFTAFSRIGKTEDLAHRLRAAFDAEYTVKKP
jgi:hypothetical protein